jgi:hypothetical protein
MVGTAAVDGYGYTAGTEESKEESDLQESKEDERGGGQRWSMDKAVDGMLYSFNVQQASGSEWVLTAFQPQQIKKWAILLSQGQLTKMGCAPRTNDQSWVSKLLDKVQHRGNAPQLDNQPLGEEMGKRQEFKRGTKANGEHILVSFTAFDAPGSEVDVVVYNVKSGQRVCTILPGGSSTNGADAFAVWGESMLSRLNTSADSAGNLSISFN